MSRPINALIAIGALAAVGGGVLALDSTVEYPAPAKEVAPIAHPVILDECPVIADDEVSQCQDARTLPNGKCLCFTTEDLTPTWDQAKTLMWVCPASDESPVSVVCQEAGPPPRPGCRVIPNSESHACGFSANGIDLGAVEPLRAFCAPCDVQPGKWGPCPACGLENNCAERCGG